MRACLPPDVILAFGPSKHTSEFTNGQRETWNTPPRRCSVIIKVLLVIICLCLLGAHVHTGNNIPEFGVHDIRVCLYVFVSSGLRTACLLHAWHHYCTQDMTDCSFCQVHTSAFPVPQQCACIFKLTVTLCSTSNAHSVMTLLTVTPSSARREQTFKNPSQDLGFVIFSGTSSLITSAIRHRLWLLLTSALNFDQIHCLATKLRANSTNVQTY